MRERWPAEGGRGPAEGRPEGGLGLSEATRGRPRAGRRPARGRPRPPNPGPPKILEGWRHEQKKQKISKKQQKMKKSNVFHWQKKQKTFEKSLNVLYHEKAKRKFRLASINIIYRQAGNFLLFSWNKTLGDFKLRPRKFFAFFANGKH